MVNEYNRRIRSGEHFREGDLVSGFIEEFGGEFRAVDVSHYHEYFGWDLWLYGGADFRMLQLAYPTTAGVWPGMPTRMNLSRCCNLCSMRQ
jgi:hypothetical protein